MKKITFMSCVLSGDINRKHGKLNLIGSKLSINKDDMGICFTSLGLEVSMFFNYCQGNTIENYAITENTNFSEANGNSNVCEGNKYLHHIHLGRNEAV